MRGKIEVASIEDKRRNARLRWLGHISIRNMDAPMRRCERIDHLEYRRSRGKTEKELKRSY